MIRRGGTTSALALGMARASRREGQGCECHPRSVRWVWVWPGVTSANTLQDCTPRECRAAERVLASSVRMLRDLRLRCGEIHLVLYRRNVRCSVRVLKNSLSTLCASMHYGSRSLSVQFRVFVTTLANPNPNDRAQYVSRVLDSGVSDSSLSVRHAQCAKKCA